MAVNYWLKAKNKKTVINEINGRLSKFIGRNINPLDQTFQNMRKVVIKYFRENPKDAELFGNNNSFHYSFDVEETNGVISKAEFVPN